MKIFIDAGHGGNDPGAVGNGMRESDINLEVSLHLNSILTGAGITTKMSRTTDIQPNMRPQTANIWGADLLVSIHTNAGGGTGTETVIPTASPRNPRRNLQECRRLAELISNSIGARFGMRVRRVNGVMLETETPRRSIGVLRESEMIAVLPEIAFIDSPLLNPDVGVLRNKRLVAAQAIADGIFEFIGVNALAPVHQAAIPSFPISEENLQAMVTLGVMQSPGHWRTVNSIRWLDELLASAAQPNRLDARINNGITDIETALKVLKMAGIMNNPGYWSRQVETSGVRFLEQLIIAIANRSLDPMHRIVWAEARSEDRIGQILAANVVLNRHNSPRFADGIYNVIHQPGQFCPVANGSYAKATPTAMQLQAVQEALGGVDYSLGATFFRTIAGAEGSWHQTALVQVLEHGNHRFYV
ncbi:MAG: N-acetylmuramoyl-L-alanine amidase [Defluviitaleaceae bacterium]|nr:N-acetylmuramoyl-L-alanine amidase [Defluviitaleaceae bacterium]